jgi:CRISPR-associated endonuclease/helicase Cas3
MLLKDHSEEAKSVAKQIVAKLGLSPELTHALTEAGFHHDDGKAHPLWQLALRGTNAGEPLAKQGYFSKPKLLGGLRHELVSALNNTSLGELAIWLILSHHGRCRPFLPVKAYDPDRPKESTELNARVPFMLEHLSRKYGLWGLAYLEAIVRGVDIQSEE